MRLIDADALKEWVETEEERKWGLSTDEVWDAIEAAPTIDPVNHGKWCIEPDGTVMHCYCCGWAYEYYAGLEEEWNYCPNCGAQMERSEE